MLSCIFFQLSTLVVPIPIAIDLPEKLCARHLLLFVRPIHPCRAQNTKPKKGFMRSSNLPHFSNNLLPSIRKWQNLSFAQNSSINIGLFRELQSYKLWNNFWTTCTFPLSGLCTSNNLPDSEFTQLPLTDKNEKNISFQIKDNE